MKCAVFSCLGLGDGLLALILSNNLHENGHEVTTFHPNFGSLQSWFPHLPIRPMPTLGDLEAYDRFFIIYERSEWMQAILKFCKDKFPNQTTVLNPIPSKRPNYPYWEEGRFELRRSMVDNLYFYCKDVLKLPQVTKSNGIRIPEQVKPKSVKNRIVIHPTSSRPGKNWPKKKYLAVKKKLEQDGYNVAFVVSSEEQKEWPEAVAFSSLSELATFVCESEWMMGNDSGIGHLASCLGLSTVTICRTRQIGYFWRPGWSPGEVLYASRWIPNLKFYRFRDKYWQKLISVRRVLASFRNLVSHTSR
jgi:hypothetical protein